MDKILSSAGNGGEPSIKQSSQWIFNLTASFYFAAVFLRAILIYRNTPGFYAIIAALLAWLILTVSQPEFTRKWPPFFIVFVGLQTSMVLGLLTIDDRSDFFATLLIILSMQVMLHLNVWIGGLWIALCAVFMVVVLAENYGAESVALSLIFTAGNVLLGSYALAVRRAQAARAENQVLAGKIRATNRELKSYATKLEGMAATRERNRLARELHDSVTQTVFSVTLTAQSAGLLLQRDHGQVRQQLEHLDELAQSALTEIKLLISELKPERRTGDGLVPALHQYLASSRFQDVLSVSLEVEGDQSLKPAEEQGLFRIVQEALNNTMKHTQVRCAQVRLHLSEPFWMEIDDQGQGFDLQQARSNGIGLSSMHERAAEIGWKLQIITSPGTGTCVRVEKCHNEERQGV